MSISIRREYVSRSSMCVCSRRERIFLEWVGVERE